MEPIKSKAFLCKDHNLPAYEICLHHGSMQNRLLCRFCKQSLLKEKLLEVVSLSDFLSGTFLTAFQTTIQQVLPKDFLQTAIQSLDTQIDLFFKELEKSVIDLLQDTKEKVLEGIIKAFPKKGLDMTVEEHISSATQALEDITNNKEESLYNRELLDNFSEQYAELVKESTRFVEKSPIIKKEIEIFMTKYTVNGELFNGFKNAIASRIGDLDILNQESSVDGDKMEEEEKTSVSRSSKRGRKKRTHNIPKDDTVFETQKKLKTSVPKEPVQAESDPIIELRFDAKGKLTQKESEYHPPEIKLRKTLLIEENKRILWGGLCYVEDKDHLVSGDFEGGLTVWDLKAWNVVCTKTLSSKIYKIMYIKEKGAILTSTERGEIYIHDVNKKYALILCYQLHTEQTFSMLYLPTQDLIASSGKEGDIILWTFLPQENSCLEKKVLDIEKHQASSFCYIEDQDILVAGMLKGGFLIALSPSEKKLSKKIKAHNKAKSIDCLTYVTQWKQVISSSEDGNIKFWDFSHLLEEVPTVACLKTLRRDDSYIESIVLFEEEKFLVHTNLDHCFSVWDLSKEKLVKNIEGHSKGESGEALIYLEDRKELVTAFGNEIRLWTVSFISK